MFSSFRCSKCLKLFSVPTWKFLKVIEVFAESKLLCDKCSKKYYGEIFDIMTSRFPLNTSPAKIIGEEKNERVIFYDSEGSEIVNCDPAWEELLKYQAVRKKKDKHLQTRMNLEGGE